MCNKKEIGERGAESEECGVVIPVIAKLGGHDATARLQALVPTLADDPLPSETMVEVRMRSYKFLFLLITKLIRTYFFLNWNNEYIFVLYCLGCYSLNIYIYIDWKQDEMIKK